MITIRHATPHDAAAVRILLGQLGYPCTEEEAATRLASLGETLTDPVLLAHDGTRPLGLIALHWAPVLNMAAPLARITAMVVDDAARGLGLGRQLVDTGAALARAAGCDLLELTTGLQRADAHAFYEALGFTRTSLRYVRKLGG